MKLTSQIKYEESIDSPTLSDSEYRLKTRNHRNFLKQPIKLGMFIPCDENDVPLDEPIDFSDWSENSIVWEAIKTESEVFNDWFIRCKKYQQAKERVLFEWFEDVNFIEKLINLNEKIEILDDLGLKLTDSAIKRLSM